MPPNLLTACGILGFERRVSSVVEEVLGYSFSQVKLAHSKKNTPVQVKFCLQNSTLVLTIENELLL